MKILVSATLFLQIVTLSVLLMKPYQITIVKREPVETTSPSGPWENYK